MRYSLSQFTNSFIQIEAVFSTNMEYIKPLVAQSLAFGSRLEYGSRKQLTLIRFVWTINPHGLQNTLSVPALDSFNLRRINLNIVLFPALSRLICV